MEFLAENKQYSAEQIEIILFQIKEENINGIKLIKMPSYYFFGYLLMQCTSPRQSKMEFRFRVRDSLFQALGQWGRLKKRARDERDLVKKKL